MTSKNIPTDKNLWEDIQSLAKGERSSPVTKGNLSVSPVNNGKGFEKFPSAYANGWALAQYKRLGGKWKKESSEFKMPRKWDKEHCESKSCDDMGFSEKASCRPYKNCYKSAQKVSVRYLESVKRDDPKKKNTGKGGLDTWFAGHGGGKPDERATWGDWVSITPVKKTITKEDGSKKTYEPGDIVGPCGISSEAEWTSITEGGKKPLKCMPREKAHKMPKEDRASLAKNKKKQESKNTGKKPVNTPTFSEEAKEIKKSASRVASRFLKSDFYRQVSPPDELSSFSQGSPIGRSPNKKETHSSLPNGDTARNIGRPSPDSPNLKFKDLHKQPRPSNREDFGYVQDSGSGSSRVIPYDSGFENKNAGSQPAQDLAGVRTWVNKNNQDQIKVDQASPEKGRADYEDGKPQRDRVLPLPDGHPKGRDEIRQGPGVINSPPDSSGQGGANRPKKDPSALNDHPSGKALNERPRSSGIPGDQYGHPYIDQSTSTGLKRRAIYKKQLLQIDSIWDIDENGELVKVSTRRILPPRPIDKQKKVRSEAKQNYTVYRRRMSKSQKHKEKVRAKLRYRRQKRRAIKYQESRRENPDRYKRREQGGIRTIKQKTKRDEKVRSKNK